MSFRTAPAALRRRRAFCPVGDASVAGARAGAFAERGAEAGAFFVLFRLVELFARAMR